MVYMVYNCVYYCDTYLGLGVLGPGLEIPPIGTNVEAEAEAEAEESGREAEAEVDARGRVNLLLFWDLG
jgi:hypothetical protein